MRLSLAKRQHLNGARTVTNVNLAIRPVVFCVKNNSHLLAKYVIWVEGAVSSDIAIKIATKYVKVMVLRNDYRNHVRVFRA